QKLENSQVKDSKYTLLCEYNNKYYLINDVNIVKNHNVGDVIICKLYVTDRVFGNDKLYVLETESK
ncbi:hypothetical protein V6O07_01175, partial [Arthrospira platensis SPKY2]